MKPIMPERSAAVKWCGILLTLTSFLLPLKFGGLAAMTEAASYFPPEAAGWLWCTWPPHGFGLWSGILLILITLALPLPGGAFRRPPVLFAVSWGILLTLAALPGVFNGGAEPDLALGEWSNAAGWGAWTLCCCRIFAADPRWGKRCAAALLAGTLLTALNGYYQYCFGFAEMQAFVREQAAKGIPLSRAMELKLTDTRIFSFLASSNALSGLLLMMLPVAGFFAWQWGSRFEPVRVSRIVFSLLFLLILGGALTLTRSRSALFALVAAGLLAVVSAPELKRRWKNAAVIAALLIVCGALVFALRFGRGFGSMTERVDYLRTSALLCAENPLNGAGWGGFFYRHMRVKFSATDESARDPHNLVAAFASQAGIPSGVLAAAVLLLPLFLLWRKRFSAWEGTVFWSGVLFTLHILMDCDMHIAPLTAGMSLLYASALIPLPEPLPIPQRQQWFAAAAGLASGVAAICGNGCFLAGEKALGELTDFVHPASAAEAERMRNFSLETLMARAEVWRPHSALIPELAGDWYLVQGRTAEAETLYRKSLEREARRPGIYRRLALCAARRGEVAEAENLMRTAQKLFPRNRKYDPDLPENREWLGIP